MLVGKTAFARAPMSGTRTTGRPRCPRWACPASAPSSKKVMAGADALRMMEVSRHRRVETVQVYVRRANLFKGHAGAEFL